MNLNDPSLSRSLLNWRNANLHFNGVAYVFPNGDDFEVIRHAIQAAWLADGYYLAFDLACRYGLHDVMCLRCVQRRMRSKKMSFVQPGSRFPSVAWRALCEHCCLDLMGVK